MRVVLPVILVFLPVIRVIELALVQIETKRLNQISAASNRQSLNVPTVEIRKLNPGGRKNK